MFIWDLISLTILLAYSFIAAVIVIEEEDAPVTPAGVEDRAPGVDDPSLFWLDPSSSISEKGNKGYKLLSNKVMI